MISRVSNCCCYLLCRWGGRGGSVTAGSSCLCRKGARSTRTTRPSTRRRTFWRTWLAAINCARISVATKRRWSPKASSRAVTKCPWRSSTSNRCRPPTPVKRSLRFHSSTPRSIQSCLIFHFCFYWTAYLTLLEWMGHVDVVYIFEHIH